MHRFAKYHRKVESWQVDIKKKTVRFFRLCLKKGRILLLENETTTGVTVHTHRMRFLHLPKGEFVEPVLLGQITSFELLHKLE